MLTKGDVSTGVLQMLDNTSRLPGLPPVGRVTSLSVRPGARCTANNGTSSRLAGSCTRGERAVPQRDLPDRRALVAAWRQVRRGGRAAGIDGVSVDNFRADASRHLERLHRQLIGGDYRARGLREVAISKPDGGSRLLRIPTVRDRIVQSAVASWLAAYFEPRMASTSFAYRRGRSVEHAVGRIVTFRLWGCVHVLDADIERFFDSVSPSRLRSCLRRELGSGAIMALIDQWLEIFEDARAGIAQGAPISPVLANIYLDPLDRALNRRGLRMVRYADDFVVLTRDAHKLDLAERRARDTLATLGLRLNTSKTRRTDFAAGFDFLGYRFLNNQVLGPDSVSAARS